MPTCLRSASPRAKKVHRCFTCRITIEPGTVYNREVYLGDDGLYEWVSCTDCSALMPFVFDYAGRPWEGVASEDYDEYAHEHAGGTDPLPASADSSAFAARAFLVRLGCDCERCDERKATAPSARPSVGRVEGGGA